MFADKNFREFREWSSNRENYYSRNLPDQTRPFPQTPFFAARDSHTCSVVRCFACCSFGSFASSLLFSSCSIHFLPNLLQAVCTLSFISEGMSTLFKYFKQSGPAVEDSKVLPKPDGPLTFLVPSSSITAANKEVKAVLNEDE